MKNRRVSAPDRPLPERCSRTLGGDIGQAIRAARRQRRLSQVQLARKCGISRRHLASIEAGANFTVAVLLAIAHELVEPAMPIADFLLRSRVDERAS